MGNNYVAPGRSRRGAKVTNLHHYENEIFKTVIDWVLQELNNRFNEVTTELLGCMACLSSDDSFSCFNKKKLIRLSKLYPLDFSDTDRGVFDTQLDSFLYDMKTSTEFADLKGIGSLASKLVETKRNLDFPLVYLLIKLVLILPVSTATVERAFSAMKIVKTRLRNKMGDQWMNDCLVTYIEKEVFQTVEDDLIMKQFQTLGHRRGQLPKKL